MISGTSFKLTALVEIKRTTYQRTAKTMCGVFSRKVSAPTPINLIMPEQAVIANYKFSRIL
jgi:hypothetical protein